MRHLLPVLLLSAGLGACKTGYASDWFRDGSSIINPQLIRYGYDVEQSRCIGQKLGETMSRQELRQFQLRAAAIRPPAGVTLAPFNLRAVAGSRVAGQLDSAVVGCNATLAAAPAVSGAAPTATADPSLPPPAAGTVPTSGGPLTSGGIPVDMTPVGTPPASGTPGTAAQARTTWLNLGAAASGQSIAIDASSIEQLGTANTAWFRMTDPETGNRTNNLYRLRIDCQARTVQPLALRQLDETGAQISMREYTPAESTPGAAEAGTVLEIAFLSLCT